MGDSRGASSGVNDTILTELVNATLNEQVQFVLFTGDLVYGSFLPATLESELLTWRTIMQPLYDAGIDIYPCRGNHDAASKQAWDNVFSGIYTLPGNGPPGEENITYSVEYGNMLIIALDQNISRHRVNQAWLDEQLSANDLPHIFVFGHEPAFKVRHTDCLDDYQAERDSFWNSLGNAGAHTYFCGHDHFYDHARVYDGDGNINNDLHQLVVGTAGAPLYGENSYNGENSIWTLYRQHFEQQFGYVLVEVNNLNVTMTWKYRVAAGEYVAGNDTWSYNYDPLSCCRSLRGNINSDVYDQFDISDLTFLIDYMFHEGSVFLCIPEADVDTSGLIDISDLTYIVDAIYHDGTAPLPCIQR